MFDAFARMRIKLQYAGLKMMSPLYGVKVEVAQDAVHTHTVKLGKQRSLAVKLNDQQLSIKYDRGALLSDDAHDLGTTAPSLVALTALVKDDAFMHHKYKKSTFQRHKMTLKILRHIRNHPSFRRIDAAHRCQNQPTKAQRKEIWDNAPVAKGFNPNSFRLDVLGGLVCKKHNKPETAGLLAFDIEHIVPRSHGGLTVVENMCLLNAAVNRYKQDAHLFICGLPQIQAKVREMSVDPAKVLKKFRSWGGKKKVKETWGLDIEKKADGLLDWV
ncbi:hypothetical protein HDU98_006378 [Podochytrium sp. JEL0797]|nr:hypothetical protein HDU98_006378 [Podochytrium sp. JEL0797]